VISQNKRSNQIKYLLFGLLVFFAEKVSFFLPFKCTLFSSLHAWHKFSIIFDVEWETWCCCCCCWCCCCCCSCCYCCRWCLPLLLYKQKKQLWAKKCLRNKKLPETYFVPFSPLHVSYNQARPQILRNGILLWLMLHYYFHTRFLNITIILYFISR